MPNWSKRRVSTPPSCGSRTTSPARRLAALVAAAFALSWVLGTAWPWAFEAFSLRAGDALFVMRYRLFGCPAERVSTRVVHLDEDDATRRDIDAERLPADFHERVIALLTRIGARAVVFDQIVTRRGDGSGALALERETAAAARVYFPVALRLRDAEAPASPAFGDLRFLDRHVWHPAVTRPGQPFAGDVVVATSRRLADACRGIGSIASRPGPDGVHRRIPLLVRYGDGYLPSISLRAACDALAVPPDNVRVAFGRVLVLPAARFPDGRVADVRIPIDRHGQAIVNFVAPWRAPGLSASHFTLGGLLEAEHDEALLGRYRDAFEDTVVVFADVTTGSRDVAAVPLDNFYYLSGLHWNVINAIFTGRFLRDLPPAAEVALDLLLAAALAWMGVRLRAAAFAAGAAGLAVLYAATVAALFLGAGILVPVGRPAFALLLATGAVLVARYVGEERDRARMRERFGNYLAPTVLSKVLEQPQLLDTCERKTVTVLFSDIAGFTPWSAGQSAETVRSTLNAYFTAMGEAIFAHEGTIDKFVGDGLMVFFNDPIPQPDHALRAVRAALDMQRAARALALRWEAAGGMALRIRIGVNTGDVVVGNMGSARRFDYTVVGTEVNLAQRLEQEAPPGGILVSRRVRDAVDGHVPLRPRGLVEVKGLPPVEAYEVEVG